MAYANLEGLGRLAEDMQTWTATHYEPKLWFDPTPVYDVTLAEAAAASSESPYQIPASIFSGNDVHAVFVKIFVPAQSANDALAVTTVFGDNSIIAQLNAVLATDDRYSYFHIYKESGLVCIQKILQSGAIAGIIDTTNTPLITTSPITGVNFRTFAGANVQIPTGTKISVWTAKEV